MKSIQISNRASKLFRSVPTLLITVCILTLSQTASAERYDPMSDEKKYTVGKDGKSVDALHSEALDDIYPSAETCKPCHEQQYKEWSVSPHAYAQISPLLNAMQGGLQLHFNGTYGDFCIRCHTPVGMALGEPDFTANKNRAPVSLEGVTCIACHRVNQNYGKFASRNPMMKGDIVAPVTGALGNELLDDAIENPDIKIVTERSNMGRPVHRKVEKFFELSKPAFCGNCHQVDIPNGFRVEEQFSEFKNSPAAQRGETCQDCHMGKIAGVAQGYNKGPGAVVGGKATKKRKVTDHMMIGPDYPLVHPGIFPHNPDAKALASNDDWATFDFSAGWGTDEFEDTVSEDYPFPKRWQDMDERYEARELVDMNLELLQEAHEKRLELLRNGFAIQQMEVNDVDGELKFSVKVDNLTDGHSVPTGFTSQRVFYLEVTVFDKDGEAIFKSGDRDPAGDIRDLNSFYVSNGALPLDEQLFSLQTRTLVRNRRGGEREQALSINTSQDPLPFLRPAKTPAMLKGRPGNVRYQKKTIPVLGSRWADYQIKDISLSRQGPFKVQVRFWAQAAPVNLIRVIQPVGFEYNMSPQQIVDALVNGKLLIQEFEVAIDGEGTIMIDPKG